MSDAIEKALVILLAAIAAWTGYEYGLEAIRQTLRFAIAALIWGDVMLFRWILQVP